MCIYYRTQYKYCRLEGCLALLFTLDSLATHKLWIIWEIVRDQGKLIETCKISKLDQPMHQLAKASSPHVWTHKLWWRWKWECIYYHFISIRNLNDIIPSTYTIIWEDFIISDLYLFTNSWKFQPKNLIFHYGLMIFRRKSRIYFSYISVTTISEDTVINIYFA